MVITSCLGLSEKRSVCSEKQEDILQKQSLGRVLQERCSEIFGKSYWKTRVQEPFFKKKVSGCRSATLFEKRLMHRFFSEKFLNFFRTAIL